MPKTLHIYLPDDLARKLKAISFERGISMSAIIQEYIVKDPLPKSDTMKTWLDGEREKHA